MMMLLRNLEPLLAIALARFNTCHRKANKSRISECKILVSFRAVMDSVEISFLKKHSF